jgi:hypothetical protein
MLKLRDYLPAMKYGAKITAQDIAGMVGLPYVGDIYYIDPTNGNDSYNGTDPKSALKTLGAAYAKLTDNNHDVIVIVPGGTGAGTGTVETAAITWSKNLCHLVGNVAPTPLSSRARITTSTASLSPFITISGQGNSFHNVQFQSGGATNLITLRLSGHRNFFENVHFANINAVAFDTATAADLELYGAQENYFVNCCVGADTVAKTTGANLRITLGATTNARNTFDDCIFPLFADADAPRFIRQGDSVGMDRWNLFRRCQFINTIGSTSTQQTDAFAIHATPGGLIVCQDCLKIGATGWSDQLGSLYLLGASSNATYNQGIGFAVNAAA